MVVAVSNYTATTNFVHATIFHATSLRLTKPTSTSFQSKLCSVLLTIHASSFSLKRYNTPKMTLLDGYGRTPHDTFEQIQSTAVLFCCLPCLCIVACYECGLSLVEKARGSKLQVKNKSQGIERKEAAVIHNTGTKASSGTYIPSESEISTNRESF